MGPQPVARLDMERNWGIEDVNGEMPAPQSDTIISTFIFSVK